MLGGWRWGRRFSPAGRLCAWCARSSGFDLPSPRGHNSIVGVHAFNPSTLEMEVGEVQGHSRLGVELKTSLGCLKKKKKISAIWGRKLVLHPLRAGVRGGGGSSQDQSSSSQKQAGAHLEEEPKWEFKAVHGWLARVALSVKARVGNQAEGASHAGSPIPPLPQAKPQASR